jgi:ParB family chromosome partitioning protein
MAAKKKAAPRKTSAGSKGKRTAKLAPNAVKRGLGATEVALPIDHADIAAVVELVRKAGGAPLGAYREPLGGRPLLLASLPFNAVQPTPFQRDLSPTHAKKLAAAIEATAAFLDPLIVVRGEDGRFWTPNGRHRLAAAKVLGLKQITVLISPDETLSYRILALNTEKAHNLKDKSLEVVRMARNLAKREPTRTEGNLRFGGGAYSPVLKKVDRLTNKALPAALREREAYASRLQEIDNEVKRIVGELQARGMKSPYLRSYVVARINPVRFHKMKAGDKKPAMPIAQALLRMSAAARKFDLAKVNLSDLAFVAAGAESSE